jgi:predicted CXXCH cytochrome family protein
VPVTTSLWKRIVWASLGAAVLSALVLLLALWRGFRAVEAPSQLEAVIAQRIRNFAIPARYSSERDPLPQGSDAEEEGRDLFLARCAVCHGTNGSGKTSVGTATYPRAPDLRQTSTQDLTDGQLHYIIAYGVRYTGMPAHQAPSGDAWKLVSFIRTLRPFVAQESSELANSLATAHYVGSEACAKCHRDIYERWKKTPMANVVRDPKHYPHAFLADITTNPVAPFPVDRVALIYGSLWKQRYFTRVGNNLYPLRVQWDIATRKWMPYHIPSHGADWWAHLYPESNMQRPTGPTCDGCHSVGYDIASHQPVEWNVGCERCHGPGSAHVQHPTRSNILNPAEISPEAETDVCIQCHSQGRPPQGAINGKYYDWPVGYRVGLRLTDYWKLEDCSLGQTSFYYFPDCTAHKNRMQGNDFVQSAMYRHQITCSSCHDVHGTSNYAELIRPANEICLDCHGPASPNGPHEESIEAHTHHKAGSPGSECVACHMPAIESEGVPGPGENVHAHTFRFISPVMTEKYGIPNPCTTCHRDRTNTWAEEAMRGWAGEPGWQLR